MVHEFYLDMAKPWQSIASDNGLFRGKLGLDGTIVAEVPDGWMGNDMGPTECVIWMGAKYEYESESAAEASVEEWRPRWRWGWGCSRTGCWKADMKCMTPAKLLCNCSTCDWRLLQVLLRASTAWTCSSWPDKTEAGILWAIMFWDEVAWGSCEADGSVTSLWPPPDLKVEGNEGEGVTACNVSINFAEKKTVFRGFFSWKDLYSLFFSHFTKTF